MADGDHRLDLDVRGILALTSLVGAFALAFVQLAVGATNGAEIPAWAAAIVAGVTGFYFGSRGGGGWDSSGAANGVKVTPKVEVTSVHPQGPTG